MGFRLKLKKVNAGYYACTLKDDSEITISKPSKNSQWEVVWTDYKAKENKDAIIFRDFARTKNDAECSILSFILKQI
jgi:hypothetical protein